MQKSVFGESNAFLMSDLPDLITRFKPQMRLFSLAAHRNRDDEDFLTALRPKLMNPIAIPDEIIHLPMIGAK